MRYRRLVAPGASFFFTVVTEERRPIFASEEAVALFTAAVENVRVRHRFDLEAQVILPDHIHAIWKMPETDSDYSKRWRLIKEAFTRGYVARFGVLPRSSSRFRKNEQAVWQRRFWEHLIRDERDFRMHVDYIHLNPVQHGLCRAAIDWPYSTFREWVQRGAYDDHWGSDTMPELPEWARRHE